MFLKRIEMQGFKSFADRVTINFDHALTGVVGPNGCGKSNIVDAIRWVLGEQSVKSLRSSQMVDVIFAGSESRRRVQFAEVSLVFDNHDRAFDSDYEEIEITRRIHRSDSSGEYLINKTACRLKDIHNLVLDSGIGRESLSMISQGTISNFAEAKPIDRRGIFEEAAGVAKYRKRKDDAVHKLERTQANLDRINDIYLELQKQVLPLKKAAQKAKIYAEKKQRLQEIEIAVISDQITQLNQRLSENQAQVNELSAQEAILEAQIQVHENTNLLARSEIHDLDQSIHEIQERLMRVMNEIQTLETRKIEIDERRKYTLEVGNSEERANELKSLYQEAKAEYEDRSTRLENINQEIIQLNQKSIEINRALIDQNSLVEESQHRLQRSKNKLEVAENLKARPFMNQAGVQSIVRAQSTLNGVFGVISNLMVPEKGYEDAISTAFGGALYNIVTKDEESARRAINFLKKNESGRATFLPLTVLRPRYINREHSIVASETKGYLGIAADFVICEPKYDVVNDSLLGNVLVVDDLENGNEMAKLLNYQYKIVTLDGDVIHRGGSMTGGRQKDNNSPLSLNKEMEELNQQIVQYQASVSSHQDKLFELSSQKSELESNLLEQRIAAAQLEPVVEAKRAKYERLKSDLDSISPSLSEEENFSDDLIDLLNKAYSDRDELKLQLESKRDTRLKKGNESERRDNQMRQQRRELSALKTTQHELDLDITRSQTNVENLMNRLSSDYQLTYEYTLEHPIEILSENAVEEVAQLREDIERLGNINMNAPADFEEVNERYEHIGTQVKEIEESRDKILGLITELDGIMIGQFTEIIEKINEVLPNVIQHMFGGGHAYLALDNPEDVLNSGIEIHVQPKGKSIKNMRLFSGGEKSLIAISVLFAILQVRHMPLCVFDEVEAALDQANVERFAHYMKHFSEENTQFIVLTHRPGTMAMCDILYGVTMQVGGVSQMLKVRLADAMMMAEPSNTSGEEIVEGEA